MSVNYPIVTVKDNFEIKFSNEKKYSSMFVKCFPQGFEKESSNYSILVTNFTATTIIEELKNALCRFYREKDNVNYEKKDLRLLFINESLNNDVKLKDLAENTILSLIRRIFKKKKV